MQGPLIAKQTGFFAVKAKTRYSVTYLEPKSRGATASRPTQVRAPVDSTGGEGE